MELVIFGPGAIGLTLGYIESYYQPRIVKIHWLTVLEFNGKEERKRVILW